MADCCGTGKKEESIATACPRCGASGKEVGRETVGAMASLTVHPEALVAGQYRTCPESTCPIVYYGGEDALLVRDDVRVPVNWKDFGAHAPLCYCFGHTRETIATETAETGASSAFSSITAKVKAGHCACDVKNPSGRCCLGDVRAFEKKVLRDAKQEEGGSVDVL